VSSRLSVRARLTLLYGAVFFAGGVILGGFSILLARHYVGPVRVDVIQGAGPPAGLIPQRRLTENAWRLTVEGLAVALGLLTLAALGAGWLAAGRALRPLREIADRAHRLAGEGAGDGSSRPAASGDELESLRHELDAVRDRLEHARAGYRRFIADASHELLTPLAVMRAGIEVSLSDPNASEEEVRSPAARRNPRTGPSSSTPRWLR
jgi:signal transduction histidine kinase